MADVNIPPMYWDIEVQHVALLNACTSPAVCDPSITIFYCNRWRWCFHHQGASVFSTERADLKWDAQNESGVFLGFGHLENTFGAVILVK
jgi:hypothetical protein